MNIKRKSYQNNNSNPFLIARNPFNIAQKLYTSSSQSNQNILKGYFSHNPYNKECNHCQQNVSIYRDLQQISFLLKNEKQNLRKISTINHKNKNIQNPFTRGKLFQQNISLNNEQTYTIKDQKLLKNLIYNNPFKPTAQENKKKLQQPQKCEQPGQPYIKKTLNHSKSMQIRIHQINLKPQIKTNNLKTPQTIQIHKITSQRESVRLSIESGNRPNQHNIFSSNQSSPTKLKSKLSPTMNDIISCRNSKQKINNQAIIQSSNLIKQIYQSRKSIQANWNSHQTNRSGIQANRNTINTNRNSFDTNINSINTNMNSIQANRNSICDKIINITKSPVKQKFKEIPIVLKIKGKQFYLNKVELIR